jgi:hypothetical protein
MADIYTEIGLELCVVIVILIIALEITFFYIQRIRGTLLMKLPDMDVGMVLDEMQEIFSKNYYTTQVDYVNKVVMVSKSTLVGSQLRVTKSRDGEIEVYSRIHTPKEMVDIMVILIFATAGIVPLFLEHIRFFLSRSFSKRELHPLLSEHSWWG